MRRFLGELKRRRVLNTASLYVVGAWVLLQVAEVLQDMLPAGTLRAVLIGLAALYPVVIFTGWFFDVSAEGIKRTPPVARTANSSGWSEANSMPSRSNLMPKFA